MGTDSYLAEQALETVLEAAVGGGDRSDSVQVFRGDESTWAQVWRRRARGRCSRSRRAVVVRTPTR